MAIPWHEHARAALAADAHVQITLEELEVPEHTPGDARVRGTVVRVFRGDRALDGQRIELEVACSRAGDEPRPEGARRVDVEVLREARALEAFIKRRGSGWGVVSWLSAPLAAPTDTPAIVVTKNDAIEPPRPWSASLTEMAELALASGLGLVFIGGGLVGLIYAIWVMIR
jgi:hypothetical protein